MGGKEDLLPKWHEGRYGCPSRMVTGCHVVQKPDGGFTTCKGIKPFVWRVEEFAEKPVYEAEGLPLPGRRVTSKGALAALSVATTLATRVRRFTNQASKGQVPQDLSRKITLCFLQIKV